MFHCPEDTVLHRSKHEMQQYQREFCSFYWNCHIFCSGLFLPMTSICTNAASWKKNIMSVTAADLFRRYHTRCQCDLSHKCYNSHTGYYEKNSNTPVDRVLLLVCRQHSLPSDDPALWFHHRTLFLEGMGGILDSYLEGDMTNKIVWTGFL